MCNMGDGHARFLCCDYKSLLSSVQSTALRGFFHQHQDIGLHGGAEVGQHLGISTCTWKTYSCTQDSRRMIIDILFSSAIDLCRTCSLVILRQLLAVPATFKCFISEGNERKRNFCLKEKGQNIFSMCTKTQSKAITFHCRCIFSQVDIYVYM